MTNFVSQEDGSQFLKIRPVQISGQGLSLSTRFCRFYIMIMQHRWTFFFNDTGTIGIKWNHRCTRFVMITRSLHI